MSCCKKKCGQSPSPPPPPQSYVPEIKSEISCCLYCCTLQGSAKKFKTDGQSADVYLDNVKLHACFQKFIYL